MHDPPFVAGCIKQGLSCANIPNMSYICAVVVVTQKHATGHDYIVFSIQAFLL